MWNTIAGENFRPRASTDASSFSAFPAPRQPDVDRMSWSPESVALNEELTEARWEVLHGLIEEEKEVRQKQISGLQNDLQHLRATMQRMTAHSEGQFAEIAELKSAVNRLVSQQEVQRRELSEMSTKMLYMSETHQQQIREIQQSMKAQMAHFADENPEEKAHFVETDRHERLSLEGFLRPNSNGKDAEDRDADGVSKLAQVCERIFDRTRSALQRELDERLKESAKQMRKEFERQITTSEADRKTLRQMADRKSALSGRSSLSGSLRTEPSKSMAPEAGRRASSEARRAQAPDSELGDSQASPRVRFRGANNPTVHRLVSTTSSAVPSVVTTPHATPRVEHRDVKGFTVPASGSTNVSPRRNVELMHQNSESRLSMRSPASQARENVTLLQSSQSRSMRSFASLRGQAGVLQAAAAMSAAASQAVPGPVPVVPARPVTAIPHPSPLPEKRGSFVIHHATSAVAAAAAAGQFRVGYP
mmetsp:Transcript_20431/g.36647  ORF Transcript_20431/g.36647 Transcript_20431/m.36647 type:complete len:477 (-) Transcript_20431:44-1474(-)